MSEENLFNLLPQEQVHQASSERCGRRASHMTGLTRRRYVSKFAATVREDLKATKSPGKLMVRRCDLHRYPVTATGRGCRRQWRGRCRRITFSRRARARAMLHVGRLVLMP